MECNYCNNPADVRIKRDPLRMEFRSIIDPIESKLPVCFECQLARWGCIRVWKARGVCICEECR